jgi:hypothetical protein
MSNKKNLGQLTKASINISTPFPLSIPSMEFNKLCVFLEQIGLGKTFINKLTWALTTICGIYISDRKQNIIEITQFILDNTFEEQNITGVIVFEYENNNTVEIELDGGKVNKSIMSIDAEVIYPTEVMYMSSQMRTFTAVKQYLTIRGMGCGILKSALKEADIVKLLSVYKLYDISVIEKMLAYCKYNETPIPKTFLEILSKEKGLALDENITHIGVDLEKNDFYFLIDGKKKYLTTYSAGEQSMINMFFVSTITHNNV